MALTELSRKSGLIDPSSGGRLDVRRTFLWEGPCTVTLAFFWPGQEGDCWVCITRSLSVGSSGKALAKQTSPSNEVWELELLRKEAAWANDGGPPPLKGQVL